MLFLWVSIFLFINSVHSQILYTKFINSTPVSYPSKPVPPAYSGPNPASYNDIVNAIPFIKGSDCCNECLFLPDLLPCAHFMGPISFSNYNCLPYVQMDDHIMCFTVGGTQPAPLFNVWYQFPTLLSTPIYLYVDYAGFCGYGSQTCREIICGTSDVKPDKLDTWVLNCACSGGACRTLTQSVYCGSMGAIVQSAKRSPLSSLQNQWQFIQTFLLIPSNASSAFISQTAWVSMYRQIGTSLTGFQYDAGDLYGNPTTTISTSGESNARNINERSVLTMCSDSTSLCTLSVPTTISQPTWTSWSGHTFGEGQTSAYARFYRSLAVYDPSNMNSATFQSTPVWCDAPTDPSSVVCTGPPTLLYSQELMTGSRYGYTLDNNRGCVGYGICPQDANGVACGGTQQGVCKHNGKCFCMAGWGGLACDQAIPQTPIPHNYLCAQFDPCSGNGVCTDFIYPDNLWASIWNTTYGAVFKPQGPYCNCYDGWRGSLTNGATLTPPAPLSNLVINGEINMYNHAFFCGASSNCSGWKAALDYMIDHQCLFFVDSANRSLSKRYLRSNTFNIDNVPSDIRVSPSGQGWANQPLWYQGNNDSQLYTPDLNHQRVINQVVKRGYNCIDGRVFASTYPAMLPPEDLPNGVLRGGNGCVACPPCVTSNSECGYSAQNYSWVFTPSSFLAYIPCLMNIDPTLSNSNTGTLSNSFYGEQPICTTANVRTICDALQWGSQDCVYPTVYIWLYTTYPTLDVPTIQSMTQASLQSFTYNLNTRNVQAQTNHPACGVGATPTGPLNPNCPQGASNIQYQQIGCNCHPNFGNSNVSNPICDAQICPQNGTLNPCGAPNNGTCITTGGTAPFIGYCQCFKGFTGNSCQFQTCPSSGNSTQTIAAGIGPNLMCGGFTTSASGIAPNQTSPLTIAPAIDCITSTGLCVCNSPYWVRNPTSGLCEIAGCALDSNGKECHAMVVYGMAPNPTLDPNNTLINVCDRKRLPSTNLATCRCYLARNLLAITDQQPTVSFYGSSCSTPYNTLGACQSPKGTYCSNAVSSTCYLNGTNSGIIPVDPTAPPSCHCLSGTTGQYCEQSLCNPSTSAGLDCSFDPLATTGVCEGYTDCPTHDVNCFQQSCMTPNCVWKCRCYFVDPANSYTRCDSLTLPSTSPTCVYYSTQNPFSPNSPPGIACNYPLTGCSYFDSQRALPAWTVCGWVGQSACVVNTTSNSLFCNCTGTGYNGTYCQYQQACGGYCNNGKCIPGQPDVCRCFDSYSGSTTNCTASNPCCNTPMCGGSLPGTLNTNNNTCTCPAGSNYTYAGSGQKALPFCYSTDDATFKGCSVSCPTYLGFECGGCGYPRGTNGGYPSRCSNHTILAYPNAPTPTCDCTKLGFDLTSDSVSSLALIPWTKASNGACVPYCYPVGGTYTGINVGSPSWNESAYYGLNTVCTCNNGWSGPRCNITIACANGGTPDYTTVPASCHCGPSSNPNLPYSSASNCTIATCNSSISTYNATLDPNHCTCYPPYGLTSTQSITCSSMCQNGGVPNTSIAACECTAPFYGTYCEKSDCINPNPSPNMCVCELPYQRYDNATGRCLNIDCVHGALLSSSSICNCYLFWSGAACDVDNCAQPPSYGSATLNTTSGSPNDYYCTCDEVYVKDGSGLCTLDVCGPYGYLASCPSDVANVPNCPYSGYSYVCMCGDGAFKPDPVTHVPTCIAPTCSPHGVLSVQNGAAKCTCYDGWHTTPAIAYQFLQYCSQYACDILDYPGSYYDTSTKSCECYPPFSDPPDCTNYTNLCGPYSLPPVMLNNISAAGASSVIDGLTSYVFLFETAIQFVPVYQCECSPGYKVATDSSLFINGTAPCVIDCNTTGTFQSFSNSCVCLSQYSGELCDVFNPTVMIVTSSSNPPIPDYGWALIAVGIIAFMAIVLSVWKFMANKRPEWFHSSRKKLKSIQQLDTEEPDTPGPEIPKTILKPPKKKQGLTSFNGNRHK